MERQAEGYARLERNMDWQARLMRVADEMRAISTQMEQEARAARQERRQVRGR